MYDFWRWEYNYGHNLDPNAAIIVPDGISASFNRFQTITQFRCVFDPSDRWMVDASWRCIDRIGICV